jgi:hydroxyethylthiazole kinase-like sugar kinase family protein
MLEVNVDDALLYGQKLAAHTRASIFLYETSVLTNGECDVEIQNAQPGVKDLHSLLPCSAAIAAACVSSVIGETEDKEDVLFQQFSHAMAFWCVAIEEAGNHANQKGRVLPGTMRPALIDALHYLKEPHVRSTARLLQRGIGCQATDTDSQTT